MQTEKIRQSKTSKQITRYSEKHNNKKISLAGRPSNCTPKHLFQRYEKDRIVLNSIAMVAI